MNSKRLKYFLIFSALLFISITAFSQVLEPVKWSYSQKMIGADQVELTFTAKIERNWHLYSQHIPMSPPATTFTFTDSKDYKRIGKVTEPKAISEFDPNFKMVLKYFKDKAVFKQKIKILSQKPFSVKGTYEFMSCDDKQCLPPNDVDFEFKINPGATAAETNVAPADTAAAIAATKDTGKVTKDTVKPAPVAASADSSVMSTANKSLWLVFFLSFLAGLLAILTPCVFPMIPMTVTFFMHDSSNKAKARLQALVYGFSIIAIYTIIGTVVAVTLGANFANFLSTHWLPNILFFIIFMVFAASFFGMFEITMPSWMVNKADSKADKGGIVGAFFMAFTLVLVSFSCTGPIVGAILVASAGGQILQPIIGMFGFSLAFALPFTLFAFFPSWLSNLPKSGGWLNSVKVVLAFIELALGLKFLSIADQTYHWHILDREVYLSLWIVIFTLCGFYLLGKLKFAHDSDSKHIGVPRLILAIITFAFVVYMIPGMFGAPLKVLSGYIPPQQSLDFDLNTIIRDNVKMSSNGQTANTSLCDTPKYKEFLHLPHGLEGYFDYDQALACSQKENKPIFVDFTGHGCVNCREMEANVWSDPRVLQRLRNNFIIVALYVDDKTELPEKEWVKSSYDGKMKTSIGKKFADFQITHFNVNAQPYYVLLDSKGEKLVAPRAYNLNIDEFIKFLDDGVAAYKKKQENE